MQYRDVVIHTNAPIFGKEHEARKSPPIQERIELNEQVWIGPLDLETANAIMDTCDPKTLGVMPPVRQFGHLYAFVREIPGYADIHRWDHDNELAGVIGLSRLIHPTSIGFDYAARIGYESSGVKQIFPAQIVGISKEAFLSPNPNVTGSLPRNYLARGSGIALALSPGCWPLHGKSRCTMHGWMTFRNSSNDRWANSAGRLVFCCADFDASSHVTADSAI